MARDSSRFIPTSLIRLPLHALFCFGQNTPTTPAVRPCSTTLDVCRSRPQTINYLSIVPSSFAAAPGRFYPQFSIGLELTSARSRKAYAAPLRRVAYQDPVTKNRYVFVTNNTTWVAQTIADIYKSRWQIELFFKWIKQHLKVKRFVGRSKNAVMTQLWVAMCMYLLLAYLKFVMRLRWSLHQMLQVLQLNMFERRPLQDLFTTPSLPAPSGSQLSLAWS